MKTYLLAAAALLVSSGSLAQAVEPGPQSQPGNPGQSAVPGQPHRFTGRMQGDRTRQQAQQMADTMFQRFDLNRDGTVTRAEAEQALEQAEAARGGDGDDGGSRTERMIARMFGDAQAVTLQQFEAQALARFDREDLNHDGVVSDSERQQGWGNRSQ